MYLLRLFLYILEYLTDKIKNNRMNQRKDQLINNLFLVFHETFLFDRVSTSK